MKNHSVLPLAPGQARNQEENQADSPEVFIPLTREQAQQLRERQPTVSPWQVLGWQAVLGLAVSLLAWLIVGKAHVAVSVLYGALAVVVPGAVFARGLGSRLTRANASTAVFGFFLWEVVKIGLTVAMLFAAAKLVPNLSWPGLLVGLVLTMKVYWVALWVRPRTVNKAD
jgi:ATP synthase protein I